MNNEKKRAPLNRTLLLNDNDYARLSRRLVRLEKKVSLNEIVNKTIHQDLFEALNYFLAEEDRSIIERRCLNLHLW
jgi:site-specific DNA-methyltransferase (adenine-specific)